ncbi:MAG: hypothetical protein LBQ55_03400, partial [Treponema sp.]|nr:hypothetical protein [Treponema sp.]
MKTRRIMTVLLLVPLLAFSCRGGPEVRPSLRDEADEQSRPAVPETPPEEPAGGDTADDTAMDDGDD